MKLKYLKWLKNPQKIPGKLKKAVDDHPEKKAIQVKATDFYLNKIEFRPFLSAMDKCIQGRKINLLDKRSLKNLAKIMQKGKGYTKRTEKAINNEIPALFQRFCDGQQTENDKKDMQDVKDFVKYLMQQEKLKIMLKM